MHRMMDDPFYAIVPLALLVGTILAGFALRRIVFAALRRWAASADSKLDSLIIPVLRGPLILWAVVLGLHIATQNSRIPPQILAWLPKVFQALWGLSLTLALSQLAGSMIRFYGDSGNGLKSVTSLSRKLVQLTILLIGVAWLLTEVFDIKITGFLATLGVGGLAVALALQDTLSNLFAGFLVSVSGLVHIGDYVRLSSGEEGFVADITWRCTTMRTRTNNLIVIPNSKLGQAIYTNFAMPDARSVASILCGVPIETDPDAVERILLDEANRAVAAMKDALTDPPPQVRFNPGPWSNSFVFQIVFSVNRFADQPGARSEMRKYIVRRLRAENIAIRFPAAAIPVINESGSD